MKKGRLTFCLFQYSFLPIFFDNRILQEVENIKLPAINMTGNFTLSPTICFIMISIHLNK